MAETTVPLAEVARILGVEAARECKMSSFETRYEIGGRLIEARSHHADCCCHGTGRMPISVDELLQPFADLALVANEVLTTLDTELGSDDTDYEQFIERTLPQALDRLVMALSSLPPRREEENDG